MKKVICLIINALLTTIILNSQQPWQKISFPGAKESEAGFKTPPPGIRNDSMVGMGWPGNRFRSSLTRSVNNPARGKDTTASLMYYLNPLATK